MPACEYEYYLLVFNSISHEVAQRTLEDKIRIHARSCDILYLFVFYDSKLSDCPLSLVDACVCPRARISGVIVKNILNTYTRKIRFQLELVPLTNSPHDRCGLSYGSLKLEKKNPRALSALNWCLVSCPFDVWGK